MDFDIVTNKYFSRWLGVDISRAQGINCVYSYLRNVRQIGYSFVHALICSVHNNKVIISYGDWAANKIKVLKDGIKAGMSVAEMAKIIGDVYGYIPLQRINFSFSGVQANADRNVFARPLNKTDYAAYLDFFKACNPGCEDVLWTEDYFLKSVDTGFWQGVWADGALVSVAEVPDMPFMADEAQEVGISTLPWYRGNGYARAACSAMLKRLIDSGICPMWSTSAENAASVRLAESVGFKTLSNEVILTNANV